VLIGAHAVISTTVPVASRWVTQLDFEYLGGYWPGGVKSSGSDWVHGPSAALALGFTGRRFLGAPSLADAGSVGPVLSVEYLFVPREERAIWYLGAGFLVRYGF